MHCGNLFVISGPSGAGKGTLVARLAKAREDVWVSVSVTTRPPRAGEADGIHYFFVSEARFKELIVQDELLEWACVHRSHYYGTLRSAVAKHIAGGQQVILEIDIQGALKVRAKMPEAHLIFIEPPSLAVLEERLRTRGSEDEGAIAARMATARMELSRKMEYDMRLVNDDLDVAAAQLVAYIEGIAGQE